MMLRCLRIALFAVLLGCATTASAAEWIELFNGENIDGWRASENKDTFKVVDGAIVANGNRSHLFYEGPVGGHDFKNFDLEVQALTKNHSNSGIYVHTKYQEEGWPSNGYEIQVNNSFLGHGAYKELKCTGSLYGVRNIYKRFISDDVWYTTRIRVVGPRVQVWINGDPVVDYIEPADGGRLSRGTIALQGHDPGSTVAFRSVKIRMLPDDLDPQLPARSEAEVAKAEQLTRVLGKSTSVIDYHVHLRGGMTVDKAVERQAATGVNIGVLRNVGRNWPIETNEQLRAFLDSVEGRPVFVGVQVNDRDWPTAFAPELLDRLDFVLGDTMIMVEDDGTEVRLFVDEQVQIDDAEAWMEKYLEHNETVLGEGITILANPTYLPNCLADRYGELWTPERMQRVIDAAVKNNVALEINAKSGLPSDQFIEMAKASGAKFTIGTNNFDDILIDTAPAIGRIEKFGLGKKDMYVPDQH